MPGDRDITRCHPRAVPELSWYSRVSPTAQNVPSVTQALSCAPAPRCLEVPLVPKCPSRCSQDAPTTSKMPLRYLLRCPDGAQDARMSPVVPLSPLRCPYAHPGAS